MFLAVDTQWDAEEGEDADVAGVGADDDVGVAEGYGDGVFAGWEGSAPVGAGGPGFVGAVVEHGWVGAAGWAGEEGAVRGEAGFVVEGSVGEVEVAEGFAVVKFDGYRVVCVLVDGPDEANEVEAEVAPFAAPWCAAGLEGCVGLR